MGGGVPDGTLGLIQVRQPEMRAELQRAQAQPLERSALNQGTEGRAFGKTEIAHEDVSNLNHRAGRGGDKSGIFEESKAQFIELDPRSTKFGQQHILRHAANADVL